MLLTNFETGFKDLVITIRNAEYKLFHALLKCYNTDLNSVHENEDCETLLIAAVRYNQCEIVKSLVSNYRCDVNVRGRGGRSLLHVAAAECDMEMLKLLTVEFGVSPLLVDEEGSTPLHACSSRDCDLSMVKLLIDHGANVNAKDRYNKTPLNIAVKLKRYRIAAALLNEDSSKEIMSKYEIEFFNLISTIRNGDFKRLLTLLEDHITDLNCVHEHEDCETLLMAAVRSNQCEIVKSLVSDYGCDVNVRGRGGRSLLHLAAAECDMEMLELLIKKFGMSPLLVDNEGNTPLHVCSYFNHTDGVRSLLYNFQSPIYIRNRAGKTPRDVIYSGTKSSSEILQTYRNVVVPSYSGMTINKIIDDYRADHQDMIEADYDVVQKLAANRYFGSHYITKLFVVGHPGAGKSSLVETLKREGFLQSLNRVSSKSVALHTAGIVPSIHTSDSYGRVQFYDFAGDPEYYSSHAAILEKLFLSDIGTNICIIVLNLVESNAKIESKYLYWITFISHNTNNVQHMPSVIVTGSHADLLPRLELKKKEDYVKTLVSKYDQVYLSLDCCGPRSKNVKLLRERIQDTSIRYSEPYSLSYEESILLGLLQKDFSNVTACTAKTIIAHIEEVKLLRLPRSVSGLYPALKKLQAIGSLLILGGRGEDCYLVLNVSQLTNEVHKRLFSKEAFSSVPDMASFNIGLLPQSLLQEVLPPYITKECLIQLQYCQEISHVEIGQDYFISPSSEDTDGSSPDESLLFFPALCKLDRSNVLWMIAPEENYCIGWLARCTNPHSSFPPRFLHVLLLRVALRFTLVTPTNPHPSHEQGQHTLLKRRCKMWKTGVHWLTEEGVECEVDVDISREVVVSVSCLENSKKSLTVFNSIISCVMEAKAEFCHSIQLQWFLLDKVGVLSDDNLFSTEEVERVLENKASTIVSVRGDTWMLSSKLLYIRSTFWDSLFSLNEESVLKYIEEVVKKWFQLGLYLDLPKRALDAIEYNNPRDVEQCKLELVTAWLSSSPSHPPCWWSLVKALQQVKDSASAACIMSDQGLHVEIQEKLLDSECRCVKPEDRFLHSLSVVVGSKWPYLASLLSLSSSEIQEVRQEGEVLSQADHAFLMLKIWASREESTYRLLFEKLKPVSLFQQCR